PMLRRGDFEKRLLETAMGSGARAGRRGAQAASPCLRSPLHIIPHNSKVRGWTITPAHFLNQQLDTVWLAD
ncbi:MAG TPA: hypothetical protein VFS98_16705, partial [Methylomirabilota bacterium]|nr:hypothetical protein [Methylomirabilota bacterium]